MISDKDIKDIAKIAKEAMEKKISNGWAVHLIEKIIRGK